MREDPPASPKRQQADWAIPERGVPGAGEVLAAALLRVLVRRLQMGRHLWRFGPRPLDREMSILERAGKWILHILQPAERNWVGARSEEHTSELQSP